MQRPNNPGGNGGQSREKRNSDLQCRGYKDECKYQLQNSINSTAHSIHIYV